MKRFQNEVWGGRQRLLELKQILRHRAIKENIILTRGVCTQVLYSLDYTPFIGADITSCFSYVLDTQGWMGTYNEAKQQQKWDMKRISIDDYKRPHFQAQEIAKDRYIAKQYQQQLSTNSKEKVFYVDDSPEVAYLGNGDWVQVVRLKHEEVNGITALANAQPLREMKAQLDGSEEKSATVVWDFDCTLSAIHLYKTWTCAKSPTAQVKKSFAKWDTILNTFLEKTVRELLLEESRRQ